MGIKFSLAVVLALILAVTVGVKLLGMQYVFGVIIPYLTVLIFFSGIIYRITKWARSPVPFRIPSTCGQQKTLPWIPYSKLDNPTTNLQTVGRMILEILAFRSLFRNTKMNLHEGPKLTYASAKFLWLGALAFHYSFLVILIRHLRFFTEPVPFFVATIESVDSWVQIGLPVLYLTDLVLVAAVTYLFVRRVVVPQLRYISLPADYFPLLVIFSLAVTGILMRYFLRVDVAGIKELTMGLVTFRPTIPENISVFFYIHLFLICVLFAYFPFSKLMHLGGVFLSPTRNLPNNNRVQRHINPWNYPVKVHTYQEYEEDFREKMIEAGLPVEKE